MKCFVPKNAESDEPYMRTKKISAFVFGPMSIRAATELTALADNLYIFRGNSPFRVRVFDFDFSWDESDDNSVLNALLRASGFVDSQPIRRSPRLGSVTGITSSAADSTALPGSTVPTPALAPTSVLANALGSKANKHSGSASSERVLSVRK